MQLEKYGYTENEIMKNARFCDMHMTSTDGPDYYEKRILSFGET